MNTSLYKDVSFLSLVSTARFFFRTTIINLLFLTTLYAETQYNISIDNGKLTSDTIFEFDVFIKSEGETFTLTSYQASLSFNQDIIDDGQISFSYIEGTSDFVSSPAIGTGLNSADGKTELTFASLPGNDIITTQIKRIGRFRLQNSNTFANTPSINWDFQGKITTILTGPSFENITNPANHVSELGEISKYHIASVVASDYDTVANTPPEGTIDGLGFYDNVNSARWAAKPMPQWIQYDLGEEKSVSQVNASFFEFDQGRVYDYSIFVSRDGKTWTQMVSHTKSDLQEWTERSFSSISVRYVRLELYSSSGNDNAQQWANIWEVEILGTGELTGIEEEKELENILPICTLEQNYPNPFNPTTSIVFGLKEDANVKLVIYNLLGEKVAELIDEYVISGNHKIEFNATNLASGIYVYRLDVGNEFTETKKMVLMR